MKTKQEVFEEAVGKLLKQGRKSYDRDTYKCLYRCGPDACVIGQLIPDEKYVPQMEYDGNVDENDLVQVVLDEQGVDISEEGLTFLLGLQNIHDCYIPDWWVEEFKKYGHQHDLNVDFLKESKLC